MPRSESRTKTAIWNDADFRLLSCRAQRFYWMLYSQSTISLCGVVAYTPKRWAGYAADETLETIESALAELEGRRYIVIDRDTEEIWVRTFVVHDGVRKNPKMLQGAGAAAEQVLSDALRDGVFTSLGMAQDTLSDGVSDGVSGTLLEAPSDGYSPRARASPSLSPSPSDMRNGVSFETDFDNTWEQYPRKRDRGAALLAYQARRREGASASDLLAATQHYAKAMSGEEERFIKYGKTFFGPSRVWADYVDGVPAGEGPAANGRPPVGPRVREQADIDASMAAAARLAGEA